MANGDQLGVVRETFTVYLCSYKPEVGVGSFELGRNCLAGFAGGESKGDEGGRDVEVLEGTGHGILSSDGGEAESLLSMEGS